MLAKPTLVTMSGQEAEFIVGGSFPIPVSQEFGQTTVNFQSYGIQLKFKPYVLGEETITMYVAPEVSTPDYSLGTMSGGVAVPGLKTRSSSTVLQLKDGQTFVMAGLLKEDVSTTFDKIPLLGDLPILGTIFTSKRYQKSESELVVVVTPRMVRALNREEVPPLPGADMDPDLSGVDFFLLNWDLKRQANQSLNDLPAFVGKTGYSQSKRN
jgi:pilus assembly protein CpaC